MFEKKQGISLYIRLRTKRTEGEASLYCRLCYNGERTTEYRLNVYVPVEPWSQKTHSLIDGHPLSELLQLRLAEIKAEHERILRTFHFQGFTDITASAIRDKWCKEYIPAKKQKAALNTPDPSATLLHTYQDYLTHLDTRPKSDKKADKTRASYRKAGEHLSNFLSKNRQLAMLAESVTPGFGMQLYDYLRTKNMSADTANRYLNFLKSALHHALLYDRIRSNGLYQFKPPKGNSAKRIVFLSESSLADLAALPLVGIRHTVRKWALFMCYTGFDYHDAVKVVANDATYRLATPNGDMWVYQRLKMKNAPAWGECNVPILPQAEKLLNELSGKKTPRLKVINTHLKEIAQKLDLPFEFCSKVCRKTAGVVFQKEGFSMQSIQKILGHQSLAMTEKHYLSIQSFVVINDMANARRNQPQTSVNPFTQIYKAS